MAGRPLLAELHARTTWSNGALNPQRARRPVRERAGFDVLASVSAAREEPSTVAKPWPTPDGLSPSERTEHPVAEPLRDWQGLVYHGS
jgi:hypothetical protein